MQIKRKRRIQIRISNTELLILKKKSEQAGVSLSEFIRGTAMAYDLAYKLTEDEVICYKELTSLSLNFQRISNYIKNKDNKGLVEEIKITMELINKHLNKF